MKNKKYRIGEIVKIINSETLVDEFKKVKYAKIKSIKLAPYTITLEFKYGIGTIDQYINIDYIRKSKKIALINIHRNLICYVIKKTRKSTHQFLKIAYGSNWKNHYQGDNK